MSKLESYNIGDIIKIPNRGYGKILNIEYHHGSAFWTSYYRYLIELICDRNGYEVLKGQKYISRCLSSRYYETVNICPIPKRAWWYYKKEI